MTSFSKSLCFIVTELFGNGITRKSPCQFIVSDHFKPHQLYSTYENWLRKIMPIAHTFPVIQSVSQNIEHNVSDPFISPWCDTECVQSKLARQKTTPDRPNTLAS